MKLPNEVGAEPGGHRAKETDTGMLPRHSPPSRPAVTSRTAGKGTKNQSSTGAGSRPGRRPCHKHGGGY